MQLKLTVDIPDSNAEVQKALLIFKKDFGPMPNWFKREVPLDGEPFPIGKRR